MRRLTLLVLFILLLCASLFPTTSNATTTSLTPDATQAVGGTCTTGALTYNGTTLLSCVSSVWVAEPITIGTQTASCTSGLAGQIQWNGSAFKGCNGSAWSVLGSGAATAAGSTGQVQFNNAGALGASSNFYWDNTNNRLGIGTTVPITPLNVVATLSSATAGSVQYWVPSITLNNTEYPGELVKVTATQNTTSYASTDGALGWVEEPSSNTNAVGYAQGVEGLVRIQSTVTPNYGAGGVDGEVYLTGTIDQSLGAIIGVTGGAENDPGASNAGSVEGGAFSATVDGGTVGNGINGIEARSTVSVGTVTNGIGGIYTQSDINGGSADWRYGIFLAAGAGTPSGSGTNDYGVYQESTTAVNYFGGNVGIGTASPYSSLTVLGAAGDPSLTDGTTSAATIGGSSSYVMSMGQNSSGPPWYYYMQVKHVGLNISGPLAINPLGGNVGIGTTVPFGTFHVRAAANNNIVFTNSTDMGTPTALGIVLNDANNNIEPLEFAASAYNFAYGNVGIGTTSPSGLLEISHAGTAYGIKMTDTTNAANSLEISNFGSGSGIVYDPQANGGNFYFGRNFTLSNFIIQSGNVGIGSTSPAAVLDVAGTTKLGSAGTTMTAMGTCTVASYTPTSTAANKTCTGVPASASVAVSCSASAAFQTPNSTVLYARATGTANQIAVNLSAANNVAVTLTCMWVQP